MKVRQISHIALKRDHEFINTVQEGSEETHSKVGLYVTVSYLIFYEFVNSLILQMLDDFRSGKCI